jgi:hypothetical protein
MIIPVFLLAAPLSLAASNNPSPAAAFSSLPSWFEPNRGQCDPTVRFFSRGTEGTLLVEERGATFVAGERAVRLRMDGSRLPLHTGVEPMPSRSFYIQGNRKSEWKGPIPHYKAVRAQGVYPGIDVLYYHSGRLLEFDLVVGPHADPNQIRLRFETNVPITQTPEGDLLLAADAGLRLKRPVAYQEQHGNRTPVEARYRLEAGEVRFELGAYDPARTLVIDPVFYSGYLGGDQDGAARSVAVDKDANVWVAGYSRAGVPRPSQPGSIQSESAGGRDAFLAKLTRNESGGLTLAYWTLFGGSQNDVANHVVVDADGFVHIAGYTDSADYPLAGTQVQQTHAGETDAFVSVLRPDDPNGQFVWYSALFGGPKKDYANAVAFDTAGAIYIAGYTTSGELPGTQPNFQCCNRGGFEGFLAKINPGLSQSLAYSTFLGGDGTDVITGLAVDAGFNVYVTGYTGTEDFPVTLPGVRAHPKSIDLFVVKLDVRRSGLDAILFGATLGGNGLDVAHSMALDSNGHVWIAGYTLSTDLPLTETAYRRAPAGQADAFVLKLDLDAAPQDRVLYGTLLGGAATDIVYSISLLPTGRIALAGYTFSPDFPILDSDAPARPSPGSADAFVTVIDPNLAGANALTFSRVLGGELSDVAHGVASDPAGRLFLAGSTSSVDLSTTDGSTKIAPPGTTQGFVLSAAPPAGR